MLFFCLSLFRCKSISPRTLRNGCPFTWWNKLSNKANAVKNQSPYIKGPCWLCIGVAYGMSGFSFCILRHVLCMYPYCTTFCMGRLKLSNFALPFATPQLHPSAWWRCPSSRTTKVITHCTSTFSTYVPVYSSLLHLSKSLLAVVTLMAVVAPTILLR